jgi:prepilin-type N-terminal cleavage/methylation domain-containing protein
MTSQNVVWKPVTRASRNRGARAGFSLLEMTAAIAVLGILAAAAVASFRLETLANFGANVDARRLAIDLTQARQRAIATGDNHVLLFSGTSGSITGYMLHRRSTDGTLTPVDESRRFPAMVEVTLSPNSPEFQAEGGAVASCVITLAAPQRTWQVTVAQATGSARVREL